MRVPPAMRTPTSASTAKVATSSADTPIGSHAMQEVIRRRVLVEGRVQGVWFRASAEREALRLRLSCVARNLNDGRVEVIVEGQSDAVDAFIAWARIGPPRADVSGVTIEAQLPTGQTGFHAR
jgi:acylphosphatase